MQAFLRRFDGIADIDTQHAFARWLERIAFFFLILMILAAPHSIAATQISWLTGMFVWVMRLLVKPRPKLVRTPLDLALWAFFGWTVLSAFCSYAPDISIDKLRNAALFLIFYFVVNLVRSKRAVYFLTCALIFSCMVNVVWTPLERIFGRGVEIHAVKPESPLAKALLKDGDTLLEANKKKIRAPEDLTAEFERNETVHLKFYRPDYNVEVDLRRADLLGGETALEKLGVGSWKKSRIWRSSGFYRFYVTYAEVLQLIASLTFGLFVVLMGHKTAGSNNLSDEERKPPLALLKSKIFDPKFVVMAICVGGLSVALLLTVTRASQLAFLISAFVIVFVGGNRKMLLLLSAVILPLALGGLFFLQHSRNVGFFDVKDNSILWRQTVYREGFNLATANARHLAVGVGLDSIKRYADEWHLFDDGRLPKSHFHSTPLQLAVERGVPALLLWLWVIWIYARVLLKNLKSKIRNPESGDWREKGIVLGSFGGLVGFFTSGLVHYNYGDAIIAMMFFIIMGLSVRLVVSDERLVDSAKTDGV